MKTVLVTGANRGLGYEFAKQYLEQGCRVIATVREASKIAALATLSERFGDTLTIKTLEVSDAISRKQFADAIGSQPIHILINNAGVSGGWGELGKLDEAAWLKVLQVNTIAPIKLTELLRANLAAAEDATVVFLSSKMGSMADNTSGGSYIYRSSKAALNAAAKSLAIELGREHIDVAILHPGWVRTDMGGPNGLIDASASVSGMRRVISGLTKDQCGAFIAYDGTMIPW